MHFSSCQKNWIFAPGHNSDELLKVITFKINGRIVKFVLDGDGSSWDAWQHEPWLTLDSLLMDELAATIFAMYPDE